MDEGFVLRFAEMKANKSIELVTYGEGNAILMMTALEVIWRPDVERVWLENAREIFAAAAGGRK